MQCGERESSAAEHDVAGARGSIRILNRHGDARIDSEYHRQPRRGGVRPGDKIIPAIAQAWLTITGRLVNASAATSTYHLAEAAL